jgi:Kelch motif
MPTARFGLESVVIDKVLYAVGGSHSGGVLNTLEAFNL